MNSDIFDDLMKVLAERKNAPADSSYTASLYAKGADKINSKITEEAAEYCEALKGADHSHQVYELCDLIFHALVGASYAGITIEEVRTELTRRFGTSGHAEKAARGK